jgi:phosphoglycolate phosphatase-like HAD superfamily hydrolase
MIKNIIFDFDGVILDSERVKTEAFRKLFENFSAANVESLLEYHHENGGISRYVKIRYFFEAILKQPICDDEIIEYANLYSQLTREALSNPAYIIKDAMQFIKNNYRQYPIHIASGADEGDLIYICDRLEVSHYFQSINGSPLAKGEIIENILKSYHYNGNETCMIGDSINDYEAAQANGIEFYGYNNLRLKENGNYIVSLREFYW